MDEDGFPETFTEKFSPFYGTVNEVKMVSPTGNVCYVTLGSAPNDKPVGNPYRQYREITKAKAGFRPYASCPLKTPCGKGSDDAACDHMEKFIAKRQKEYAKKAEVDAAKYSEARMLKMMNSLAKANSEKAE